MQQNFSHFALQNISEQFYHDMSLTFNEHYVRAKKKKQLLTVSVTNSKSTFRVC